MLQFALHNKNPVRPNPRRETLAVSLSEFYLYTYIFSESLNAKLYCNKILMYMQSDGPAPRRLINYIYDYKLVLIPMRLNHGRPVLRLPPASVQSDRLANSSNLG